MPSTLDTLIGRVADETLRSELRAAAAELRKITDFGLVFEAHLPETLRLPHHPIRRGIKVTGRATVDNSMFEVIAVDGATVTVRRLRQSDGVVVSEQEAGEVQDEGSSARSVGA